MREDTTTAKPTENKKKRDKKIAVPRSFMANVVSDVVDKGICIGCGICVAMCPNRNLDMVMCVNGDLAPTDLGQCRNNCSICLQVCPFSNEGPNETELASIRLSSYKQYNIDVDFDTNTGYVFKCYAGYSKINDQRANSSSGGMATWVLEQLIEQKKVDSVVCVVPTNKHDPLFEYKVVKDIESIRFGSGSHYYPVPVDNVLKQILKDKSNETYAIIGLPCVLKGITKCISLMPHLRRKVKYLLGLACGHLPNRYYTEYACCLSNIAPLTANSVRYRIKDANKKANIYKFQAKSQTRYGKEVPFAPPLSTAWTDCHFQYNACNYCDDVFAEVADVCFMDAWLSRYIEDSRGTNLLLIRNPSIDQILSFGFKMGQCQLETVSISDILASQTTPILTKKRKIAGRLYDMSKKGIQIKKRVAPSVIMYLLYYPEFVLKRYLQERSKSLWPEYKKRPPEDYQSKFFFISKMLFIIKLFQRLYRVLSNPRKIIHILKIDSNILGRRMHLKKNKHN